MKSSTFLALLAAAAVSTGALAHDDKSLDAMKAPSGGQLRMAGDYHFELVLARDSKEPKDNPVLVYVTDHADKKIPTQGATGKVTLVGKGGFKAEVTLAPDGDNRLKGTALYASDPSLVAVVQVTIAGKKAEQARFTPLAAKPAVDKHKH